MFMLFTLSKILDFNYKQKYWCDQQSTISTWWLRNDPVFSALKWSRTEARSNNPPRRKWYANSKTSKTWYGEKRIAPLRHFRAAIPKPIAPQIEEFVSSIVSRAIELSHCEKYAHFHEMAPPIYPSSTRFECELTCKEEFKSNKEIKELKEKSKSILTEAKDAL